MQLFIIFKVGSTVSIFFPRVALLKTCSYRVPGLADISSVNNSAIRGNSRMSELQVPISAWQLRTHKQRCRNYHRSEKCSERIC